MNDEVRMVTVDVANVAEHGFFCFKSKPKSEGYRRKLAWLKQRFAEGMQLKIVYEDRRQVGFVEFIPGEFTWRAVNAKDYLLEFCDTRGYLAPDTLTNDQSQHNRPSQVVALRS